MSVVPEAIGSLAAAIVHGARRLSEAHGRRELEAAPSIEALLADPAVDMAFAQVLAAGVGPSRRHLVILIVVAVGRQVLGVWERNYPEQDGPMQAINAAEIWAACPCDEHAEGAAAAAKKAVDESLAVWHRPAKQAAWAGRTAAWVAAAPKYGWQAVAAMVGACNASSTEVVVGTVESFLSTKLEAA